MVGDRLPRADEAVIPDEKLVEYALNPHHPVGKHKARVFSSALGLTRQDAPYLSAAIRDAVLTSPVTEIRSTGGSGYLYAVPILLEGRNGAAHGVMTAWIYDPAVAEPPRLVTTYVDLP